MARARWRLGAQLCRRLLALLQRGRGRQQLLLLQGMLLQWQQQQQQQQQQQRRPPRGAQRALEEEELQEALGSTSAPLRPL